MTPKAEMRALQYREFGAGPELVEIRIPEPTGKEVLLKVDAAGICHSDAFLMDVPQEQYIFGSLPLTLGHECVGTVIGAGADAGIVEGDRFAVYGPWGCGLCRNCARGEENYCLHRASRRLHPPGLGSPGAMAEYMIVDDVRHLVPLGDLDAVQAVPLTDAGLTPYHAIQGSIGKLRAGTVAVVIGVGGLGHLAVQILRAVTPVTVIAVDVDESKVQLAERVGAHVALISDDTVGERIWDATGRLGASVVFDFVGAQSTLELAAKVAGINSEIVAVGIGRGRLPVGYGAIPRGTAVRTPYWGARHELVEVLDLARDGRLSVSVEAFTLDQAPEAYSRMRAGTIEGRAVVVP
jgi:propanol-preferring alcohol dehydrogenase